jgi:hypothetical protein
LDRQIGSKGGAIALLDEWIEAYRDLEREHERLRMQYRNACKRLEHAQAAIRNDLHPPQVIKEKVHF